MNQKASLDFPLRDEDRKNRQATHIAPLQPPILAAFRPWGDSAGAGRVRPAGRKYNGKLVVTRCKFKQIVTLKTDCI